MSLKEEFPNLYEVSCLKEVFVAALGGFSDNRWSCNDFGVSTSTIVEFDLSDKLLYFRNCLEDFGGFSGGKDLVVWTSNSDEIFSVASFYSFYDIDLIPFGPPNKFDDVFGWRFLLDRIPTKDNLVHRGMLFPLDASKCVFCGLVGESRNHSFFGCVVVNIFWSEIALWIGKEYSRKDECLSSFMD